MFIFFDTAIQFSRIANPDELTTGLAILIVGILVLLAWASIKLKSISSMSVWMFTVLALISSLVLGTPFRLFLIVAMVNAIMLVANVAIYVIYGTRV